MSVEVLNLYGKGKWRYWILILNNTIQETISEKNLATNKLFSEEETKNQNEEYGESM